MKKNKKFFIVYIIKNLGVFCVSVIYAYTKTA